jgi:CRP-like cAMP-binding protein
MTEVKSNAGLRDVAAEEKERWATLAKTIEFFEPFSKEEILVVLNHASVKRFPMSEYIFRENSEGFTFYVLLKGKVNIVKTDHVKNRKVQLASLQAGECFGEMVAFLDGKRTAAVITAVECFVFIVEMAELSAMPVELQNKILRRVAAFMARKLKSQSETVVNKILGNATGLGL